MIDVVAKSERRKSRELPPPARRGTFCRGVRTTELNDLDQAIYLLAVRLLDNGGTATAIRRSIVSLHRDWW